MSDATTFHAGALPEVDFDLTLHGDPAAPAWEVLHVAWREALSRVPEGSVVVASTDPSAVADDLLGRAVTLTLSRGHLERRLHGVVHAVDDLGGGGHHRFARLSIASTLWFLGRRVDSRIFQGASAVAIAAEVLRTGRLPVALRAVDVPAALRDAPPREYCVQYRESDLAFVSRLLEDEGVAWRAVADAGGERFVMVDALAPWGATPTLDGAPAPVAGAAAETLAVESVRALRTRRRVVSTGVRLADHDFTRPQAKGDLARAHPADPGLYPVYEHPANYTLHGWDAAHDAWTRHDAAERARVRWEEIDVEAREAHGASNVTGLEPGRALELSGDRAARWHVVSVEHEGHAWDDVADEVRADPELARVFAELGLALDGPRYANRFRAVHEGTVWRPARVTPRPKIEGPQTATVRGLAGGDDEIVTDAHGRVRVEFHWDRPGARTPSQRDKSTSCWVRVAQVWAGAQWGFSFIPRVGMEVVVQFAEGDPDRPMVTGCVYNGENRAPEALPDARTRAVVRTRSTPGGGGYNELSFEDRAGAELVHLRAQRDLDEAVLHDQTTRVERDRVLRVGRDRAASVGGRDALDVGGDRVVTVERDDSLTVEGDLSLRVQGERGARVSVDAAWALVADRAITLECGTSRIVMAPDRITLTADAIDARALHDHNLEGAMVNINCDDLAADAPSRARALREQMLRLGMGDTVAEMERGGAPAGLDARQLWRRTALSMQDWLAAQPELFQDRLVLRAGLVMAAMLREAPVDAPASPAVSEAVGARFRKPIERAEASGDRARAALLREAMSAADRDAREAVGFARRFDGAMAQDPAWGAMRHDDAEAGRDALERQAQCVARQRVLAWSDRHEGAPGAAHATSVMASATRRAVRAGIAVGPSPRPPPAEAGGGARE